MALNASEVVEARGMGRYTFPYRNMSTAPATLPVTFTGPDQDFFGGRTVELRSLRARAPSYNSEHWCKTPNGRMAPFANDSSIARLRSKREV
jgi:hypothetical protein